MPVATEIPVSERSKAFRDLHHLTREALARLLRVDSKIVRKIENGYTSPHNPTVLRLEKLMQTYRPRKTGPHALEPADAPLTTLVLPVAAELAPVPVPAAIVPVPLVAQEPVEEEEDDEPEPEEDDEEAKEEAGAEDQKEKPEILAAWFRNCHNHLPGPPVRLKRAVPDDTKDKPSIIGPLQPDTLVNLRMDDYQREAIGGKSEEQYEEDYRNGDSMPVILLGMRGTDYEMLNDGTAVLHDPVFIIDGGQRQVGALRAMATGVVPSLTARIYLGTDEAWERWKFRKANIGRPVSPNVHLRNMQADVPFMAMLGEFTRDPRFPLEGHVQWTQKPRVGDLMSAIGLVKAMSRLFSRYRPGLLVRDYQTMVPLLQEVMVDLGRQVMYDNWLYYWNIVNDAFDARNANFNKTTYSVRQPFTVAFCLVLGSHRNFWAGNRLKFPTALRSRLRSFPFGAPTINSLCKNAILGTGSEDLAQYIVNWLNKGTLDRKLRGNPLHRFDEDQ